MGSSFVRLLAKSGIILDRLIGLTSAVSTFAVWCCGALFVMVSVLIGVEVVIRKAFGASIYGVDELSGFALAFGIAWGFSFTLLHRAHIRVDTIYIWLPIRIRAALDIVALTAFVGFMSLVALSTGGVLSQSITSSSVGYTQLEVPLVIPQTIWVAGYCFFLVVAFLLLIRNILAFLSGDAITVQKEIGSPGITESIESELRDAQTKEGGRI